MKGSLSQLGATAARAAAERLETIGLAGDLGDADAARATLEAEVRRLGPLLSRLTLAPTCAAPR
jgi:hypothetical protein